MATNQAYEVKKHVADLVETLLPNHAVEYGYWAPNYERSCVVFGGIRWEDTSFSSMGGVFTTNRYSIEVLLTVFSPDQRAVETENDAWQAFKLIDQAIKSDVSLSGKVRWAICKPERLGSIPSSNDSVAQSLVAFDIEVMENDE